MTDCRPENGLPITETSKEHMMLFPAWSDRVYVTNVFPSVKMLLGGDTVVVMNPGMSSTAVGSGQVTMVLTSIGPIICTTGEVGQGIVNVGGVTSEE